MSKKDVIRKITGRLRTLSFRTGVIVAACSAICYVLSFAQMLLPIGTVAKSVLWTLFFGLAKACQYTALAILGKAGVTRLRHILGRKKADRSTDSRGKS